mmetsp:Transcript_16264/g.31787  ORF Transcript_16264/g.31787 Transcript_16264/m.31787 type:complete len:798 (-) Transcript_16264:267-2660(-)
MESSGKNTRTSTSRAPLAPRGPNNSNGPSSYNPRPKTSSYAPRRKLIIKPFKVQPRPPAGFEEKSLARLSAAVQVIQKKEAFAYSREELYRLVECLCIHDKAEAVFQRLHAQCKAHIDGTIRDLASASSRCVPGGKEEAGASTVAKQDEGFLGLVRGMWEDHCTSFDLIRSIFLYLDRTYVLCNPRLTTIKGMGRRLLKLSLRYHKAALDHIIRCSLALIQRDRANIRAADASLLQPVCDMLKQLEIYSEAFEGPFLEATSHFYGAEGKKLSDELAVPKYLSHVEKRIDDEKRRVAMYLSQETRRPLVSAVEVGLIQPFVSKLLEKGLDTLVSKLDMEELSRMFRVFGRVRDGLPKMQKAFHNHIKKAGGFVVNPKRLTKKMTPREAWEEEKKIIPNLLAYTKDLEKLVDGPFQKKPEFIRALNGGCEYFIGTADLKVATLLARYFDALMRNNVKFRGTNEEQISSMLKAPLKLFSHVPSKDVFQGLYQKDFGSRLLTGRSASRKAEKMMLQRLKAACGSAFTKSMEAMFRDMDTSDTEYEKFRRGVAANEAKAPTVEFSVRVLSAGSWPEIANTDGIKLPQEIKFSQKAFEDYYVKNHKGQRLTWQYMRASAIISAEFPKGKKELVVTAFQAAVLLQLSERTEGVTAKQLTKDAGLEVKHLEPALRALLEAKLIEKSPPGRRIAPTDKISANAGFRSSLHRIKVEQVETRARLQDQKKVQDKVIADRGLVIDATVVRIMKIRKTLAHKDLMQETFKMIGSKFTCTTRDVKKQIDRLLNREYLERDENNPEVYNYKA